MIINKQLKKQTNLQLFEFCGSSKHGNDVTFIHKRSQEFVEYFNGVILDVKLAGCSTQIRGK